MNMNALGEILGPGMAILFFAWVVKLFFDWKRLKLKDSLNHKLMDKFGTSQDLVQFVEKDGGKTFLNSLVIPSINSRNQLLSSISKGVILTCLSIGLFIVAGMFTNDAAQFFKVIGILSIALGLGFIITTAVSYLLSKKWGIIDNEEDNLDN